MTHAGGRAWLIAPAIALVAATPAAAFVAFQSPSKNIGCYIGAGSVRCDIAKRDWEPPPKPESCPVEWGNGLTVGKRGRAQYVCAGDTALGAGKVLPYGSSVERGRFRCKSKLSGMRCVNTRNGHGFKLSRQRAKLF